MLVGDGPDVTFIGTLKHLKIPSSVAPLADLASRPRKRILAAESKQQLTGAAKPEHGRS